MTQLKGRYDPGIIQYKGVDKLEQVALDGNLDPEQTKMLYRLFEQNM